MPINVNDEMSSEEAFNSLAAERKNLDAKQVRQPRNDIALVIPLVFGALSYFKALRKQMAKLPDLDLDAIDKLEQRSFALIKAQTNYLVSSESPGALRELAEEASRTRKVLFADAQALASRGFINPGSLDDYSGGTGYKVIATDLQIVSTVLKNHWSKIKGKCAVDLAELDRADKMASRILRLVGLKMQSDSEPDPSADDRNRAYTLVEQSYDEFCRAVDFLRWKEGDAETIAPSLYSARKRSTPKEEPVTPPDQPSPVAPTPVNRNLDNLPGGSPFIDG